jgi:hypothetical protein
MSPISMARQSLGLSLAIEQFGAGYFGRGARPGGVLTFPGQLSPEARQNLRRSFEELHAGGANSHRVALLEAGLKWEAIGVPPDDSQFLQSREFQVVEVARWFNIPPHKLRDLNKPSYNSLEMMNIEFLTDTLRPWLVRWEQSLNRKIIRPKDRGNYFCEHNVEGVLRGDIASRYQAYSVARNWGWLSVNEIREKENMNGVGPEGDVYMQPLNMQALGTAPTAAPATAPSLVAAPAPEPDPTTPTRSDESILLRLLDDAGERLQSIECNAVKRFANKPGEFLAKIDHFVGEHRSRVVSAYFPVLEAFGLEADIEKHVQRHLDQFRSVWLDFSGSVTASKLAEAVSEKITTMKGVNHDN